MAAKEFQRDAFFNRLYEKAREDRDIVIVVADMSAPALDQFRLNLPNQFINVGIAEQNAIQIASGLALSGKTVFAYAISPFITLRALEQIRVSNCIMSIPITIVGMGTGLSYENDGPTHHLVEDLAVMRAFPRLTIHNITDNRMARAMVDISCDRSATNYVRLDKDSYPPLYAPDFDFTAGLHQVRNGEECILLTSGVMAHVALEAAARLEENGISIGVIDIFQLPINQQLLFNKIANAKKLISLEEHFLAGGFGSAVCEVLTDGAKATPLLRIGMDMDEAYNHSYTYGGRQLIRKAYGIDSESVARKTAAFITGAS